MKKKKNQNLKYIVIAEVVLLLCLCVGGAIGAVYYLRSVPAITESAQTPTQPPADATVVSILTVEPSMTKTIIPIVTPEPKGTTLEKQADGTIKFTDLDGGYEITLPAGWLAVRPGNEDEFNAMLAKEGAKNSMLVDQMNTDKAGYDAKFDRLLSYPVRPDLKKNVIFGFSKTFFDPSDRVPIDNSSMGDWVRHVETMNIVPNLRISASNIVENGNKINFMVVKGRFSLKNSQGELVPFVATIWFFKPTSGSLVSMTFTVLQDYQDQLAPDLDAIRESVKLLGQ